MAAETRTDAEAVGRIDPADLERRANAMRAGLGDEAEALVVDLLTVVRIQRRMLLDGVPAHLTPSERRLGETIMRLTRERDALLSALAEARAERDRLAAAERERIATALDDEAGLTPCEEDAKVVKGCALLVRADFSYDAADARAALATPAREGGENG